MKAQVRSNSFLFSFLIVYGCSGCRPNTSRTLFTWDTFPWERFIFSPSSSWAVWFSCGSSKPPGLPSSFLWWLIYAKLETYPSQLFLQLYVISDDLAWCPQVLALVFIRKLLDFIFTKRELSWLDDLMPESKKKKLEDAEREVSICEIPE